jgi:hypothetical protein
MLNLMFIDCFKYKKTYIKDIPNIDFVNIKGYTLCVIYFIYDNENYLMYLYKDTHQLYKGKIEINNLYLQVIKEKQYIPTKNSILNNLRQNFNNIDNLIHINHIYMNI